MSRKGIAGLVLIGIVVAAVGFFVLSINIKQERQEEIESTTATLADLAKSINISLDQFIKPTLVCFINSECEHCQWQVGSLFREKQSLINANFIFISIEPRDSLVNYLSGVGFDGDKTLAFEKTPELMKKSLGSTSTPQILVYNNNQLVRHFRGETRVDLILESLSK